MTVNNLNNNSQLQVDYALVQRARDTLDAQEDKATDFDESLGEVGYQMAKIGKQFPEKIIEVDQQYDVILEEIQTFQKAIEEAKKWSDVELLGKVENLVSQGNDLEKKFNEMFPKLEEAIAEISK